MEKKKRTRARLEEGEENPGKIGWTFLQATVLLSSAHLGDDKKMSVIIIINYYYYYINALQYIHRTIANKKTEVQQYKETK